MTAIRFRKASSLDQAKGEVYCVHDGKNIVTYDKKTANNLKRISAKEIANSNDSWVCTTSSFAHDKGIS